jgi:hypothetical protein
LEEMVARWGDWAFNKLMKVEHELTFNGAQEERDPEITAPIYTYRGEKLTRDEFMAVFLDDEIDTEDMPELYKKGVR